MARFTKVAIRFLANLVGCFGIDLKQLLEEGVKLLIEDKPSVVTPPLPVAIPVQVVQAQLPEAIPVLPVAKPPQAAPVSPKLVSPVVAPPIVVPQRRSSERLENETWELWKDFQYDLEDGELEAAKEKIGQFFAAGYDGQRLIDTLQQFVALGFLEKWITEGLVFKYKMKKGEDFVHFPSLTQVPQSKRAMVLLYAHLNRAWSRKHKKSHSSSYTGNGQAKGNGKTAKVEALRGGLEKRESERHDRQLKRVQNSPKGVTGSKPNPHGNKNKK